GSPPAPGGPRAASSCRPPGRGRRRRTVWQPQRPLEGVGALADGRRGPVEDPRHLGGEVPTAREQLSRRAIRHDLTPSEEHDPLREGGRELDVVRGHQHRRPATRQLLDQTAHLLLEPPVESSRRLAEQQAARWLAPTRAASGHDDREGQPLALAAGEIPGIRAPHPLEPEEAKCRLAGLPRQLLVDALAYEEI